MVVVGWGSRRGGEVGASRSEKPEFPEPKRDIQPQQRLSTDPGSSSAEAAKANQMQRELLCATVCLVRPGSARGAGTGGRPLYSTNSLQTSFGSCTSSS